MLATYDQDRVPTIPGPGMGEMGWGFKSAFKKLKKGVKKGTKLAKKGVKWSPAGITARVALGAAKKAKLGKGLKKVGKFAKSHKLLIAAPGAAAALWGAKKVVKKAFGPKKPKAITMPDGEVIEPDAVEEETGIPSEAVADAAMEANKAGDDEDARQEAVDAVEEKYGLEDDALQPVAEATEEGSDEGEGEEFDGMGWSITGGLKTIGRGIKKGAKATGKGIKIGAKATGKVAWKGAKIAGKGAVSASKTALTTAAQRYGLISTPKDEGGFLQPERVKSVLPWVAGGAVVLVGGYLLLGRKRSRA